MQAWTVQEDDGMWLVLHNGKAVGRSLTEKGAWKSAWRRANTSAQKRGVSPALIGGTLTVAGADASGAVAQASRRQRHQAAAQRLGFGTIDKLVSQVLALNDDDAAGVASALRKS